MIKYSIVVPIYNDENLCSEFCLEFYKTFKIFLNKEDIADDVELIFVDDGSTRNETKLDLFSISKSYNFVKIIELSRNFGQHIALSCAYKESIGKYVGMLNVDMQDPPSELLVILNEIEKGEFDIVYGIVEERQTSITNKITSRFFNKLINFLTNDNTPLNIATIRIMNRKFINAYNTLTEKSRYLPGLETWLGFSKGYVFTKHQPRTKGNSSYTLKGRLAMAIDSIISFSDYPLKLIALFGIIVSIIGMVLISYLIITSLFFINYLPGYSSTIVIIVLLCGIQIMVIGFSAIYIGRILKEVQNRPLYIIKNKLNFE